MLAKVFIALFSLGMYFIRNFYLVFRTARFFAYKNIIVLFSLAIFLILIFPLTSYFIIKQDGPFLKLIYYVASVWLGILAVSAFVFVTFEILNFLLRKYGNYNLMTPQMGVILILLVLSISAYGLWNASFVRVKNIDLKMNNLQKDLKILYLSDIHIDTINDISYLQKIINQINGVGADLVVINGDLVYIGHFSDQHFSIFNQIKAPAIFTYGNHEMYFGKAKVNEILKGSNLKIMENEMIDFSGVQIIGLQNIEGIDNSQSRELLSDLLSKFDIDKSKPSILVLHEPVGPEISQSYGIDLQLGGHTHNGQVFPFNLFVRLGFKYIYGLYDVDGMYMYTSSGAGTWGPPMRLGSDSEMVVFNISKK